MTRRIPFAAVSALLVFGLASQADPPSGEPKPPNKLTREELKKLRGEPPPWKVDGPNYIAVSRKSGTVTAVGKEFIEVRAVGETEAKRYQAHEILSSGRIIYWETDATSYLLDDVKVGDEVMVGTGILRDTNFAMYLSIERRPGGKIPASRNPSERRPHHEWLQARIDFKEKGIPIPEHLQDKFEPKPVKAPPTEKSEKKDDKK
jgi:hypothetical protein